MRSCSFSPQKTSDIPYLPKLSPTLYTTSILNSGSTLDSPRELLNDTSARPYAQRHLFTWSGIRPQPCWYSFFLIPKWFYHSEKVESQFSLTSTVLSLVQLLNAFFLTMLKLTQYCKTGSKVLDDSKSVNPLWLRGPPVEDPARAITAADGSRT